MAYMLIYGYLSIGFISFALVLFVITTIRKAIESGTLEELADKVDIDALILEQVEMTAQMQLPYLFGMIVVGWLPLLVRVVIAIQNEE